MSETSQKPVRIADRAPSTRQAVHDYVQTGIGFIGCLRDKTDLDRSVAAVSDDERLKSPMAYLPVRAKPRGRTKPASDPYYGVRHRVTLSSFSDTDMVRATEWVADVRHRVTLSSFSDTDTKRKYPDPGA